ncbi:uncharacterized protein LOC107039319 [Diachasma alloeum]|uniref:uncharacterized protein LOC107039319 n=1 Tax=Diachasma alloeum TaxID=454923 RepID=UPI000738229F|nr:uncharacterized protein LOC107039319 [Diachasma alloeum]
MLHFLTFATIMEFVTSLCLLVSAAHLSVAYDPNQKPILRQIHNKITADGLYLPSNSWWQSKRSSIRWSDSYTWYDWVKYSKDIPEDSTIRLDYTVQWFDDGIIWDDWVTMFHDSVFLCDTSEDTQDASIIAIVRELLGIPEGCPVSKGTTKDTSGIHFPLQDEELLWNVNVKGKTIRILTNMWSSDQKGAEKLFTGDFYVEGDSYLPFEEDSDDD